jgi:predicted RNase H-like nuclease (RuvC/YqgF family)
MSDSNKLDKIEAAIKFARENAIVLGFLGTAVPFIFGLGYTAITEINKAKDALSQFTDIVEQFSEYKSKVATLERENATLKERLNQTNESVANTQMRLSDAYINAKEAKTKSDQVERTTTRELEVLGQALKTEIQAVRRATSNRLGN